MLANDNSVCLHAQSSRWAKKKGANESTSQAIAHETLPCLPRQLLCDPTVTIQSDISIIGNFGNMPEKNPKKNKKIKKFYKVLPKPRLQYYKEG